MKMNKRIIALILSLVMIFSFIPCNVYAINKDTYSIELKDSVTGNYVFSSELKHDVKIDLFLNGEYQTTYDESYMYPNYANLEAGKETLCVIGPILLPESCDLKYKTCNLYPASNILTECHTAKSYYENKIDDLSVGAKEYPTDNQDIDQYFLVLPVIKRVVKKLDSHTISQIDALADLYELNHKEAEEYVASMMNPDDFDNDRIFFLDFFKYLYAELFYNYSDYDDIEDYIVYYSSLTLMNDDLKELDKKAKLFSLFLSFSEVRDLGDVTNGVVGVYKSNNIHTKLKENLGCLGNPEYVDGTFFNLFIENFKDLFDAYMSLYDDPLTYVSPISETLLHLYLEDSRDTPLFNGEVDRFSQYMETMMMTWITHGAESCDLDDLIYCMDLVKACDEEIKEWASENTSFDDIMKQISNGEEYLNNVTGPHIVPQDATKEEEDIARWKIITRFICDMQLIAESCMYNGNIDEYKACVGEQILYDDLAKLVNVISSDLKTDYTNFDALEQCIIEIIPDYLMEFKKIVRQNLNDTYTNDHYRQIRQKLKDEVTPKSSSKKYKANDTKDTAEKISGSGKKGSTRTITPIEGKKVASVVVTDKDGNKVDVALNEDGTYSFIQPASNVDVQVNYKNREIVLNIGSTNASVDGETSNLDAAPVIRNDRTMLPIRFVAENLGAKVEWNELEPNMVYITRGDIKIEIKLGSNIAKVNGKEYELDSVAFAENDRTYLPVRFVSEALNAIVEWNESKPNEVKIYEQ